jgi:poly(hydroxyalkanoate) depolymerase family esterase
MLAAIALLCAAPSGAAAPPDRAGTLERHTYTNEHGTRPYVLYIPAKLKRGAPVFVYLHGCTQTADDAVMGTRLNELASQEGFVVVYPEQDPAANGSRCWNWFLPDHQARGMGEPSLIAGITGEIVARFHASEEHVFVFGASAGGAMSSIMAATYPDLFGAAGIIAAPAFGGVDISGELAYRAMGDLARPVPVIIFQGTADLLVDYPLGRTAITQWLGTNDLADDGTRNGSLSPNPEVEHRGTSPNAQPGSGEPCVPPPNSFPCIGGAVGLQDQYPHTIERYSDGDGTVWVEFWSIHGLGHAYPGGDPRGNFVDPLGPDVGRAAFDYFMLHADDTRGKGRSS